MNRGIAFRTAYLLAGVRRTREGRSGRFVRPMRLGRFAPVRPSAGLEDRGNEARTAAGRPVGASSSVEAAAGAARGPPSPRLRCSVERRDELSPP